MRIVPACSASFAMVLVLACSDTRSDGAGGTDSGDTTADGNGDDGGDDGAGDGGATGSGGGGSETGDGGDDGGTGSGGSSESGGATTGDGGSTSGGGGTSGGDTSTTSGQGNVEYAAFAVVGALDRIVVRKADYDQDLCGHLVVAWPWEPPGLFPDVTMPAQWGVESAAVFEGTTDCLVGEHIPPGGSEDADTATGYVDFEFITPGTYPCSLDLDVSMTFAPVAPEPWIPNELTMAALDLAVEGC